MRPCGAFELFWLDVFLGSIINSCGSQLALNLLCLSGVVLVTLTVCHLGCSIVVHWNFATIALTLFGKRRVVLSSQVS